MLSSSAVSTRRAVPAGLAGETEGVTLTGRAYPGATRLTRAAA
jgi:hypothetical protein